MSRAAVYYTSYSRALTKYVSSGFFARDLDADDFAFIEDVRERGTVRCGSLAWPTPTACTYSDNVYARVALVEELDYWRQPYGIDQVAVRRHGPLQRRPAQPVGSTPMALKRKRDRELAVAARAAEYAEVQRRAQEKQVEQIRRDLEWEQASPAERLKLRPRLKLRAFGRVTGRHYIPQWKVDELEGVEQQAIEQWQAPQQAPRRTDAEPTKEAAAAVRETIKSRIVVVLKLIFPTIVTFEELMLRIGCDDKALVMSCADELITSGSLRKHAL